jgi:hypothetical protein
MAGARRQHNRLIVRSLRIIEAQLEGGNCEA